MKQEEKSEISYQKIIQAAMIEFGTHPYEVASLNTICKEYHISKGLLYHHFENKDQLYLRCIQICFDDLSESMKNIDNNQDDIETGMKKIFEKRHIFFKENPYHSYLFFQTIFQPPQHLRKDIQIIRKSFDELNTSYYESILKSVSLKADYTYADALECFQTLGEMVQTYDQSQIYEDIELSLAIQKHERRLYNMLKIMLYGIVEESV